MGSPRPKCKCVIELGGKQGLPGMTCEGSRVLQENEEGRESTQGIDAVVPYWAETSIAGDGKELRELTGRRI